MYRACSSRHRHRHGCLRGDRHVFFFHLRAHNQHVDYSGAHNWVLRSRFRQARSKDQEIFKRREVAGTQLDPQFSLPRRDHEYGGGAGLSKLDVFCFELSKLFVNSSATDTVLVTLSSTAVAETTTAQCTSRWAMARGHRLNTSIVLAAVYGLSGVFRTVSAVESSLSRPLPTLSPSLIGHLASVDVKQHENKVVLVRHKRNQNGGGVRKGWSGGGGGGIL